MAKFYVIDGLDGCGKATQTELLKQELEKMGKKVKKIDFPKYESDSSAPVRMYLNGELGSDPTLLNPYACGTLYAVDRFIQYVTDWKKYFDEDDNTIIIADRYVSANIIHQAGKITDREERNKYIEWCLDSEHNKFGLPRENLTMYLTIKPESSQKLLTSRYHGDNTKKDIHEGNLEYLNNCYFRFLESFAYINPDNHILNAVHIKCDSNNQNGVDSIEHIHKVIMYYILKDLANEDLTKELCSINSVDVE